ncbi:hypothetical protein FACS1894132_13020 [Clostridia bacterium]|nr:hypothetical protein FACS1894132_13020 [Clostridia bacterium]
MNQQKTIPDPILDPKETNTLDVLTERYNKLTEPSKVSKALKTAGSKVGEFIPDKVKSFGNAVALSVSEQEIYKQALEIITKGFKDVEEMVAKISISEKSIVSKINKSTSNITISSLDDICFVRSYDISKLVSSYKTKDFFLAFVEGGTTGFFGFAGIPFNLVLSTFIYFRAVQSIAMYYGYDVKNSVEELVISSEIFTEALSPAHKDVNNELTAVISKIMLMSQATMVKQMANKTWTEMAKRGGIPLLIAQMRALAYKSAQKALENAGKKGLENTLFREVFEQIGRKLTLKTVQRAVPVISSAIGAFIDANQMRKVLDYADVFYQKRFILEKENRIMTAIGGGELIVELVRNK